MSDIVERLRNATPPQDATPCEGSVRGEGTFTLTYAEREAVAASMIGCVNERTHATLRGLLERLK